MGQIANDLDLRMMARCIELSRDAITAGELPFACVICRDGEVVVEATNRVARDRDVTRHAEMVAMSEVQQVLGTRRLSRCTLYSNVEPCGMCSYCIRETQIGRVAYALGSPVMGGLSKWNILRDEGISDRIPQIFGAVPEVVSGILVHEAHKRGKTGTRWLGG